MSIPKRFVFKEDLFRDRTMRKFFEKYEGHIFEIDHVMDLEKDPVGGHVWLKCIDDPEFVMKNYVHIYDLECLNPDK